MKNTAKIIIFLAIVFILIGIVFVAQKVFAPTISVTPLVSEQSQTEYSTLSLSYPQSSETKYPELFDYIQKSKKDFVDEVGAITPIDAKVLELGGDRKYDFEVTTKIATSTKTVSYIIYTYTFSGGAHGNTDVATFTYGVDGKLINLGDIFIVPYLQKISDLARAYFYDTIDAGYFQKDVVDGGTAPTADNYSAWYLTDQNIVFIFGQYQVGPYVLGILEFSLDKKSVENILNPKYKIQIEL